MTGIKAPSCHYRMTENEEKKVEWIISTLSKKPILELNDQELNNHLILKKLGKYRKLVFERLAFKSHHILDLNKSRRRYGYEEFKIGVSHKIEPTLYDLLELLFLYKNN